MSDATLWKAWCDGSSLSNPGPSGFAVYVQRPDGTEFTTHGSSSRKRSNNEAELYALIRAFMAIPEGQPGVVYADSKYALSAIELRAAWIARGMRTAAGTPLKNVGMIEKLWAEVDAKPLVRAEWTKGHAEDAGNHRVDGLAKRAAQEFQRTGKRVKAITRELTDRPCLI